MWNQCVCAVVVIALSTTSAKATLEDELSSIMTEKAVMFLAKPLTLPDIKDPPFKGTVTAVNPKANTKVKVVRFSLNNDTINLNASVTSKLSLAGTLGKDNTKLNAEFDLSVSMDVSFQLFQENDEFFVKGQVKDINLNVVFTKLEPANLSGGTGLLTRLANAELLAHKQQLIQQLNSMATRISIKL
jgi:hypothetical protein